MITLEDQKALLGQKNTTIYHKDYGTGRLESAREDKYENNRIKAEIFFLENDLFDTYEKPYFLYLDDENLSLEPYENA